MRVWLSDSCGHRIRMMKPIYLDGGFFLAPIAGRFCWQALRAAIRLHANRQTCRNKSGGMAPVSAVPFYMAKLFEPDGLTHHGRDKVLAI